jgi:hypothetical protein
MEKNYPIGGYAPGNYHCICAICNTKFQGDKRAVQCEPCATKAVGQPTEDQAYWLKGFHNKYSRWYLAKCLMITKKELTKWMKQLGLSKTRKGSLTEDQKRFIVDNYKLMTAPQISAKIKVNSVLIYSFISRNGLQKQERTKETTPIKRKLLLNILRDAK